MLDPISVVTCVHTKAVVLLGTIIWFDYSPLFTTFWLRNLNNIVSVSQFAFLQVDDAVESLVVRHPYYYFYSSVIDQRSFGIIVQA